MNFSAMHDVKRGMNRVYGHSMEGTEKTGQTITNMRRIGNFVVIPLQILNIYGSRSLDATAWDILALNE